MRMAVNAVYYRLKKGKSVMFSFGYVLVMVICMTCLGETREAASCVRRLVPFPATAAGSRRSQETMAQCGCDDSIASCMSLKSARYRG